MNDMNKIFFRNRKAMSNRAIEPTQTYGSSLLANLKAGNSTDRKNVKGV